jgi:pimeloyl-ACP methyl ester carboxylesterase
MAKNNFIIQLKLFSFFILLVLIGCSCDKGSKNSPKDKGSKFEKSESKSGEPGKAIILFHGLYDVDTKTETSNLAYLEDVLKKDFLDCTILIPSRLDSGTSSIEEQARNMFNIVKDKRLLNKDFVLVGDSQGGLVAFSFYDQFKDQVKIKGLITNHTPWEGAPIINSNKNDIKSFSDKLATLIDANPSTKKEIDDIAQAFGFTSITTKEMIYTTILNALADYQEDGKAGIKDLQPNSPFISSISKKLPTSTIPILALAGTEVEFSEAFLSLLSSLSLDMLDSIKKLDKANLNSLEPEWAKIVGALSNKHDVFVPTDSQVAATLKGKNVGFKRLVYNKYHHFLGMQNKTIYNQLIKTIESYFENE